MTAATSERVSWSSLDDVELTPLAQQPTPAPRQQPREREIPPSVGFAWVMEGLRPYLGIGCVVAGVVSILLGWYGVSGEVIVAKQVPYLASGGLLGICFFILGGRLLLIQDLRRDSGRLDHVEVLVEELHAVLLEQRRQLDSFGLERTQSIPLVRGNASVRAGSQVGPLARAAHADTAHADTAHADTGHADTAHADTAHADTGHADPAPRVVPGGATYHRDGCAMLTGKRVSVLKPATAIKRELTACPLCGPAPLSA